MSELTDHVALISGAAGGIAQSIAQHFAAAGASVALIDLHVEPLERLEGQLRSNNLEALAISTDLRDGASVQAAVRRTLEVYGKLSIVVNAAGVLKTGPIDTMLEEDWDAVMNVNVRGVYQTCKHAIPALREYGLGASIVNLSSVSAFVGSDIGSAYHTSKGAILSLTYALAQELAPHQIRVNAICPGWVNAGFTQQALEVSPDPAALQAAARANHLLGRMAEPLEIAEAALFLASARASFITGTHLTVDGGFMVKR